MKARSRVILGIILVVWVILAIWSFHWAAWYFGIIILLEGASYFLIRYLRQSSQWLITSSDRFPVFDKVALKRFLEHAYDPEFGWVRKPGTEKEEIGENGRKSIYHIDEKGSRVNPGHEMWPKIISCYGDSFTFARQINDNETFEWHLSEMTQTNVLNFGVGNFGVDQALLRLKREYPNNRTDIVIMGVVPSTIVRILSVWKHYNEFGNIFGFKPRYVISDGKLKLIKNIIDQEDKFLRYREFLPEINRYDEFYETKFHKDMIRFPYFVSVLKDPVRNFPLLSLIAWDRWCVREKKLRPYPLHFQVIMKTNLKLRRDLFKSNRKAVELLERLVLEFADYSRQQSFRPVFMWMPQKDDVLYIKSKTNFYKELIGRIQNEIDVIDLTQELLKRADLDDLYCDDSHYGGHFSKSGNKFIAEIIYRVLKEKGILKSHTRV